MSEKIERKINKKEAVIEFPRVKKIPLTKWFLVCEKDLKIISAKLDEFTKANESRKIQTKILSRQLDEIMVLRQKLKRYEG